jgi:sortase (surface protein transpeptidase)
MALSLEELKQQRAQIQKHLDWLDAAIAELGPASEEPKASEAEPTTAPAKPALPTEPPTSSTATGTATGEAKVPKVEIEGQVYQSKTQDELRHARIGCFLFFLLGIVLFLFLLFGLPYYL